MRTSAPINTRVRTKVARAHLLCGEWLRRQPPEAGRAQNLRTAAEMFAVMPARAFTARAERERSPAGERARKRTVETREDLTTQEVQIARLARDGLSNPEIGARLFISPRTVEYHLGKVFSMLNIISRGQLNRALP